MNRRRLLAALATGSTAALAGCGYAYGGGDVRRTAFAGGTSVFMAGWSAHATAGDRIVFAESGDSPFEGERTAVDVIDRDAAVRWSFRHGDRSVGMAVDPAAERVYLRELGGVVAVTPPDESAGMGGADGTDDPDDTGRMEDTDGMDGGPSRRPDTPDWRASLADLTAEPVDGDGSSGNEPDDGEPGTDDSDEERPIAADAHGAYVAVDAEVVAVREGGVAWTVEPSASVDSSPPVDGLWGGGSDGPDGVVAVAGDAVVALAPDGSRRWRYEVGNEPTLTVDGDLVLCRDGDAVVALDRPDGGEAWRTEVGSGGVPPRVIEDRVAVTARGETRVLDRQSGDPLWRAGGAPGRDRYRSLVVDGGRAYYVGRGGEAIAVDADGRVWTRELELSGGKAVDGWLVDGAVAFAFDSGEFVWLQRRDEDPGLL
ncbi:MULTISPECIES: PQQ-binding-like beta-propeller repeat protein [Haloferacaceae]|uniref:PQQ-binding-like beta-propeller repeat protein n=1 Tax=Halorubrum glutamatedens TaxID=2707018 RepID=A0ABD5QPZ5_9EURY|nr:PQQ-binding-like beta-propeller repeat protein [Halobellus captivus]